MTDSYIYIRRRQNSSPICVLNRSDNFLLLFALDVIKLWYMFLFDEGALIGNTVYWRLYRIALLNLVKKSQQNLCHVLCSDQFYRKLVISFDSFLISYFAVFS